MYCLNTVVRSLLLIMYAVKADRSSCHSVTTEFRSPSNAVTINNITGIPNGVSAGP